MIDLIEWFRQVPSYRFVPLFQLKQGLEVETWTKTVRGTTRKLLMRNPQMEQAIIDIVENGLPDDAWEGLLYVMGVHALPNFVPLYVGKAERRGVTHAISANLKNIRRNKDRFARWGDNLAYHIGDLSHSLFKFNAYRKPTKKYERWATTLFASRDPPMLKEVAYIYIAPWVRSEHGPSSLSCSLPAVENEVIALASVQFGDRLLNVEGI